MQGAFLGPAFSNAEIEQFLKAKDAPYVRLSDADVVDPHCRGTRRREGHRWFQGRMEFGPRALGARSIIGDARSPKMQSVMNLKIKYRESFRPFAPRSCGSGSPSILRWTPTVRTCCWWPLSSKDGARP